MLFIYCVGFIIPQICNIYINGYFKDKKPTNDIVIIQIILYVICGMTQYLFYTFEYAEIQYSSLGSYFQDGWNYIDSSQGIFYLI